MILIIQFNRIANKKKMNIRIVHDRIKETVLFLGPTRRPLKCTFSTPRLIPRVIQIESEVILLNNSRVYDVSSYFHLHHIRNNNNEINLTAPGNDK